VLISFAQQTLFASDLETGEGDVSDDQEAWLAALGLALTRGGPDAVSGRVRPCPAVCRLGAAVVGLPPATATVGHTPETALGDRSTSTGKP
jgi:hypothetical protein